ncbi:zeta toxin family protein [Microbacterium sp. B2969]|uniref:UDP-N-acetylglucosamine kinase n=1 Tax=Microbacterium alkaliflavum TaxID=3248839 RepID=A0ABW7QDG7_9MICO
MTEWTPSEPEQVRIFEERIAPVVFAHSTADSPTLVVLDGQVGSGAPAAASRLATEYSDGIAIVSNEGLTAFHPHFLELSRSRSPEATRLLAEPTAGWMTRSLRHARTTGRSMLLQGTFHTPSAVLAACDVFAQSGFATRVVVVATPRAESLLAAASRYMLDVRAGRGGRFTSVESHDVGFDTTGALTATLETSPSVDRLTILGTGGAVLFEAERTDASSFAGATQALRRGQAQSMSAPRSMRWLSELRAVTDFALSMGRPSSPVGELLIELHTVALAEVLPRMPLPTDSQARTAGEATLTRQLVELRRTVPVERPAVDVAAPVVAPPGPDRGISR